MTFKPGDRCRINVYEAWRSDGPRVLDAVVHMVTAEGQPASFAVDAMIEGFVGWLPVIWRDGKAYTFGGSLVDVEGPGRE
jgi:hypothetical protein